MKANHKSLLLTAAFSLAAAVVSAQATRVDVVTTTDISGHNSTYVNGRSPLRQSHFLKLPIGSIRPTGWMGRLLTLQANGLNGQLNTVAGWLWKEKNAWLQTGGERGWEEVPYWLKGYGNLAYILGDKDMIKEAKVWIEGALRSQRADGFFGPENKEKDRPELWAQMIMLWCLQSYYEYSGDERVLKLMTGYFRWELALPDDVFLKDYWENSRGGDNLYSVYWLYNRTGDDFLLELAHKIHRCTANWHQDTSLPNWHNVNIAQGIREPATYWMQTGDPAMLRATYNDQQLIRRVSGQVPGGMFGGDENTRLGYIDPRQGVETCGMVEQMASDEMMLRFTGDPMWAENCEDVAFNSYTAALMPDLRSLRYMTSPNMTVSDAANHAPSIQNGGAMLAMNPINYRCCQHNHGQGWPYYAEHLVLATPDDGLAVALYAPCETTAKVAGGKQVKLTEVTRYPFEETVDFTLDLKGKVDFPLYLRLPSWCAAPEVAVNGERLNLPAGSKGYVRLSRTWQKGDRVSLRLPMTLHKRVWQVNQNSVSVDYGPLTLSLKIKERYVKRNPTEAGASLGSCIPTIDISKWPAYEIFADSPWNYALDADLSHIVQLERRPWPADDYPFTTEAVPLQFKARAARVPGWTFDETGLCGVLPPETAERGQLEDVTLIPMGAARLRISAFPQYQHDGTDGK